MADNDGFILNIDEHKVESIPKPVVKSSGGSSVNKIALLRKKMKQKALAVQMEERAKKEKLRTEEKRLMGRITRLEREKEIPESFRFTGWNKEVEKPARNPFTLLVTNVVYGLTEENIADIFGEHCTVLRVQLTMQEVEITAETDRLPPQKAYVEVAAGAIIGEVTYNTHGMLLASSDKTDARRLHVQVDDQGARTVVLANVWELTEQQVRDVVSDTMVRPLNMDSNLARVDPKQRAGLRLLWNKERPDQLKRVFLEYENVKLAKKAMGRLTEGFKTAGTKAFAHSLKEFVTLQNERKERIPRKRKNADRDLDVPLDEHRQASRLHNASSSYGDRTIREESRFVARGGVRGGGSGGGGRDGRRFRR